jgi:diguanylate cyclase (GGDEF)-like protein/PAS domain S-box-containing protein
MHYESTQFSNLLMLALLSALATILYVRLGTRVLRTQPRDRLNQLFFLVCICFACWSFAYTLLPSAPESKVWLWFKLSSPGWTLTPSLLLHFLLLLAGREALLRRRWVYAVIYAPGLFYFAQALRGAGHMGVVDFAPSAWGWSDLYGALTPSYAGYLIFFNLFIGLGLWQIHSWGKRAELVSHKRSARLIVWIGAPVLLLAGASGVFLPWLGVRSVPEASHLLTVVWVLAIQHAISRYRLMSVTPVVVAQDILETISDVVVLLDREEKIVDINRAGSECFEVDRKSLAGEDLAALFDGDEKQRIHDLMAGEGPPALEIRLPAEGQEDGALLSVSASEINDHLDQLVAKVLILRDVTEQKRAEEQLRYSALHDALTGLPNRSGIKDRLGRAAERAARHKRSFAVLIFDLDDFKDINDTYGHNVGDEVLQHVARMLSHAIRGVDSVSRLAGDEFLLLVEDLERAAEVEIVVDRILTAVAKPFHVGDQRIVTTGSMGISIFPHDGSDDAALVRNADLALYSAKAGGKSRYHFFDASMEEAHRRRVTVERGLRTAIEDGTLHLDYQPIVDLKMQEITSIEALARWQSAELGLVPPADFIPIAERTGLIAEIGEWVLRTACRQNIEWHQDLTCEIPVSVNISAKQLHQPGFVEMVEAVLTETGIPPHLLELELTETAALEDMDSSERVVKALVALGVRILIDDFGTGHSSLTRLRRLPMHAVKIDRSFIRNLPRRQKDRAMVSAIIEMARALHVGVIAEGVETMDQLSALQSILGDSPASDDPQRLQGFLFSRPVPPDELTELLRERVSVDDDRALGSRAS